MLDMDTLLPRFWAKVNKTTTCWIWNAAIADTGYGIFSVGHGKLISAHRFSWLVAHGAMPVGQLDHICRVRSCINPDHLEQVSPRTNMLRGISPAAIQARRTHCIRGHALNGDNLYVFRNHRQCRACRKAAKELWIKSHR